MEYNIELKDISIRVPEVDADIKIGLLKTNVTGLSISEMIQAAKELPNIVWNMRQAFELPVDPDNVTLGTPESLEVINKPRTREERIKETEKNHVSAFQQFILNEYDLFEFSAQFHGESGIMFFNHKTSDLRFLVVSDLFDEPLEGQVTEWVFADNVGLNNVEGGFDIYCNQNLKPSKALVDNKEALMHQAFVKGVERRYFGGSHEHLKFNYDEQEDVGHVASNMGHNFVIVPHHKEALHAPHVDESLHPIMINEISVNDYRCRIYRVTYPVMPASTVRPGIITADQLRVGMDISAIMRDGSMIVGHVTEMTQHHIVCGNLQHKVPIHEMEVIVYMRDHFFDEDAVGPEDDQDEPTGVIEEGTMIPFDLITPGMNLDLIYCTPDGTLKDMTITVVSKKPNHITYTGAWNDPLLEQYISKIIFNGYAE